MFKENIKGVKWISLLSFKLDYSSSKRSCSSALHLFKVGNRIDFKTTKSLSDANFMLSPDFNTVIAVSDQWTHSYVYVPASIEFKLALPFKKIADDVRHWRRCASMRARKISSCCWRAASTVKPNSWYIVWRWDQGSLCLTSHYKYLARLVVWVCPSGWGPMVPEMTSTNCSWWATAVKI